MSRELPAKPSLEFLRKQAKQIQRTMTQGKLADARSTFWPESNNRHNRQKRPNRRYLRAKCGQNSTKWPVG
jgi:hypothetical protein